MLFGLYNGKTQKEHIDEVIEKMMDKAGWSQSYGAEFTRLGLDYVAVAIAIGVWWLERKVAFRDSRWLIGALCLAYFGFSWGAWLWRRTAEKEASYTGTKDGQQVWIKTTYVKNTDKFEVLLTKPEGSENTTHTKEFKLQEIIDTRGIVHEDVLKPLVKWLDVKKKSE